MWKTPHREGLTEATFENTGRGLLYCILLIFAQHEWQSLVAEVSLSEVEMLCLQVTHYWVDSAYF